MRIATMLVMLAFALGCGAQDDRGVSAGPGEETLSATGQDCVDLVQEGEFEQAIPVCTKAASEAPENTAVAEALEQARVGVEAGAADARAAAEEAAKRLGQ